MINDIGQSNTPRNGKALAGIILLALGVILLVQQLNFFFIPHWLFSGPMWLIYLGLFIGAKSNFHKPSAFLLILLGGVLLIDNNIHGASGIIWPIGVIAVGLWLILRKRGSIDTQQFKKNYGNKWDWRGHTGSVSGTAGYSPNDVPPPAGGDTKSYGPTGDDYLDTVSVFGGVKKTILSKNFRGGEVVNIFGGAELDFTQADITGRVILDITQIFGGTKIIIPSHWQVVSDIAAVFGSIDDKRIRSTAAINSEKILVLKGVSIFAGIDIRSY